MPITRTSSDYIEIIKKELNDDDHIHPYHLSDKQIQSFIRHFESIVTRLIKKRKQVYLYHLFISTKKKQPKDKIY